MDKHDMVKRRIEGYTYEAIAKEAGVSRQRIQQLLAPPKEIRDYIITKYRGLCFDCGLIVNKSGHVHHENSDAEDFNDIDNLVLLCKSCHRKRHHFGPPRREFMNKEDILGLRKKLRLTQKEFAGRLKVDAITISRWERGEQKPSAQAERQLNRLIKRS